MKRINMAKYGFIRSEEDDFNNDGNHFTCYRHNKDSKVVVSKLVSDGQVYLRGHGSFDGKLAYDEYSTLPHYKDLDALNGVDYDDLTEEDLVKLYNDCVAYEREYDEAVSKLTLPTVDEVKEYFNEAKQLRIKEYEEIKNLYMENFDTIISQNVDNYETKELYRHLRYLKSSTNKFTDEYVTAQCSNLYAARVWLKAAHELKPSFDYRYSKEILEGWIKKV